ncbi:hypothetical protein NC653_013819 [Populus alba x Populus x berolinensis]|uniref:Uncharacterized protein n=1 Tax=Populus alba x Populus x berolinensis TaxID=444605 RepID=A0AAD6QWE3_9ROSI|nr:hypothetical protein NC653_013819 [Populus alba x Populus x berolinensis]
MIHILSLVLKKSIWQTCVLWPIKVKRRYNLWMMRTSFLI